MAKGLFASSAMHIQPIPEDMTVAKNTPFQSELPTSKFVRRLGFRAMIYAIVINVVRPAIISVLMVVLFSFSLKIFSITFSSFE